MKPATVDGTDANIHAGVELGTSNEKVTLKFNNSDKALSNYKDTDSGVITNAVTTDEDKDGTDDTTTITKTAAFVLPTYTAAGVYRYTVKEEVPADEDKNSFVSYDSTNVYTVNVVVSYVDGKLGVTSIVAANTAKEDDKDNIVFYNSIGTADLKITKTVTGNGGDLDAEFGFAIRVPMEGEDLNLPENTTFSAQIYESKEGQKTAVGDPITIHVQGSKAYPTITATKDTDGKVTGYEAEDADVFKLKSGQWLEITNLPVGMIFYVVEYNYSEDGYTTSFSYTAMDSGSTTAAQSISSTTSEPRRVNGTIYSGSNELDYVNDKALNVGTGINLDVLPYVVVLAIALGGCVLFIFSKKRRTVR
jgi:pilin isopeptide linkage protein